MNKKPTKYADLFFDFQSALIEYGNAVRLLTIRCVDNQLNGIKEDLEPYRERENAAKVKVLQKYNDVLTALQTQEQTL